MVSLGSVVTEVAAVVAVVLVVSAVSVVAAVAAVVAAKPAVIKKRFVVAATVSSDLGPGVPVLVEDLMAALDEVGGLGA